MKKQIIFTAALLACIISANSQIVYLGPRFSLAHEDAKWSSNNGSGTFYENMDITLAIPFGFFIGEHFILGLENQYSQSLDKDYDSNGGVDQTTYSYITFGPFFRWQTKISDNFIFFLDLNSLYGIGSYTNDDWTGTSFDTYKENTVVINPNLSPGVALHLSKKFMLEMQMGRIYYELHTTTPDENNNDMKENISFGGIQLNYFSLGAAFWF